MSLGPASFALLVIITAISLTRRLLVFELSATSTLIFGKARPGIILYSVFTFPGTIIHELSHWLVAELLRVPTGKISVIPIKSEVEREERLGSVMTASTDPFRGFLIGIAPFLSGIVLLGVMADLLTTWWGTEPWWVLTLLIYGMIIVGNSFMISREDRRYWPIISIIVLLLIIVFYSLNLTVPMFILTRLNNLVKHLSTVLLIALLLNAILLGVMFGVRYTVQRIIGQKIVTKRRKNL